MTTTSGPRRKAARSVAAAAATLAATLLLGSCAGGTAGETDGIPEKGAALTIAKPDGAITTESNSPGVGDASALALGDISFGIDEYVNPRLPSAGERARNKKRPSAKRPKRSTA